MSFKDILRIWTDRTTKCSHCGRIHYIARISKIPGKQKEKLRFVKCHLPVHPRDLARGVKGYLGSYFEEIEGKGYCVDVYDYPISMKKTYIAIAERAKEKEEKQSKEELEEQEREKHGSKFTSMKTWMQRKR